MTEAQMAEKPMTVATDEATSSFADTRQRRFAVCCCRRKNIRHSESIEMRPESLRLA
jgi:hypothetical protein